MKHKNCRICGLNNSDVEAAVQRTNQEAKSATVILRWGGYCDSTFSETTSFLQLRSR
jgi:hypothetical protein